MPAGGESARQIDEASVPIVDHHAERHDFAALAASWRFVAELTGAMRRSGMTI